MRNITLEELLEAGCHFGHQVTRQNPKARDFIFEARDNIHIIDLAKTKEGLDEAAARVKEIAQKPDATFLLVGTKRQAQPIIEEELKKFDFKAAGVYFVTKHWVGGTLTNLAAVQKNFQRLRELEDNLRDEDVKARYTKKEIGLWDKERQKLDYLYSGVADMKRLPDVIFAVDTHQEELAVREGRRSGVPVVGIVDTNANPEIVDYVIPANDDAVGSLKLIIGYILEAWKEGKLAKDANEKNVNDVKGEDTKRTETKKNDSKDAKNAKTEKVKSAKKETKSSKVSKKSEK